LVSTIVPESHVLSRASTIPSGKRNLKLRRITLSFSRKTLDTSARSNAWRQVIDQAFFVNLFGSPMAKPNFARKLARSIEPTGGPGALPETLEDAARFIGAHEATAQARPYWDHCTGEIRKAAQSGKRTDIVEGPATMTAAQGSLRGAR
jgi:hypothetical protein